MGNKMYIYLLVILLSLTPFSFNVLISSDASAAVVNSARIRSALIKWISNNMSPKEIARTKDVDMFDGEFFRNLNTITDNLDSVDPIDFHPANLRPRSVENMENSFNYSFRQERARLKGDFITGNLSAPNLPIEVLIEVRLISKLSVHNTFKWLDNHLTRLSHELALIKRVSKPLRDTNFEIILFTKAVARDLHGILGKMVDLNRALNRTRGQVPDLGLFIAKLWKTSKQAEKIFFHDDIYNMRDEFQDLITSLYRRIEGYDISIRNTNDVRVIQRIAYLRTIDRRLLTSFDRAAVEGRHPQLTEMMIRASNEVYNIPARNVDILDESATLLDETLHMIDEILEGL